MQKIKPDDHAYDILIVCTRFNRLSNTWAAEFFFNWNVLIVRRSQLCFCAGVFKNLCNDPLTRSCVSVCRHIFPVCWRADVELPVRCSGQGQPLSYLSASMSFPRLFFLFFSQQSQLIKLQINSGSPKQRFHHCITHEFSWRSSLYFSNTEKKFLENSVLLRIDKIRQKIGTWLKNG